MTLSTTPAQGMGLNYHHLDGLSQPNLLHCTEAEARKLAAVDDLLEALQAMLEAFGKNGLGGEYDPGEVPAIDLALAATAKALGEQA